MLFEAIFRNTHPGFLVMILQNSVGAFAVCDTFTPGYQDQHALLLNTGEPALQGHT